jgi:hypothetical protein
MYEELAFKLHLPSALAVRTTPRSWWSPPKLIRAALAAAGLLAGSTLAPAPLMSQSSGSGALAFLVQDGLQYTEQRRYSDAINVLEEAWERDPSNPIVAEHLALAYLYEKIPPTAEALMKAQELMRFSLEHGGQITVFAQHLHRGLRWASPDHHCSGRLVLSSNGLHYRTSLTEHSFSLSPEKLASIDPSLSTQPSSTGGLILRVRKGKRLRIRTGTLSRFEAQIVLQLTREFLLGD